MVLVPTFVSLFAGVGGFDRALENHGFTCAGQVEIEPYPRAVLRRHWPDVPKHDDVATAVEWWQHLHGGDAREAPQVDLVCGGFP